MIKRASVLTTLMGTGILAVLFLAGCSNEMNQLQGDYAGWGEATRWYDLDDSCEPVGDGYDYAWDLGVSALQLHKAVSGIVVITESWQLPFIGTNESGRIEAALDYDPVQGTGHRCVFNIVAEDTSGDLIAEVLTLDEDAGETSCTEYYNGACTSKLVITAGELTRVSD